MRRREVRGHGGPAFLVPPTRAHGSGRKTDIAAAPLLPGRSPLSGRETRPCPAPPSVPHPRRGRRRHTREAGVPPAGTGRGGGGTALGTCIAAVAPQVAGYIQRHQPWALDGVTLAPKPDTRSQTETEANPKAVHAPHCGAGAPSWRDVGAERSGVCSRGANLRKGGDVPTGRDASARHSARATACPHCQGTVHASQLASVWREEARGTPEEAARADPRRRRRGGLAGGPARHLQTRRRRT